MPFFIAAASCASRAFPVLGNRPYPPRMREVTVTQDTISQEPGKAMPARWRMSVLAVASLVVGIAVGVTFARTTADEAYPGDGGVVYVCNGKALAFVHASGLKNLEMEVQFPVRGDGNLLPLPVDGVEVLAGRATGYQYYRPVDGKLAVARDVSPPQGDTVMALVGSRSVTVRVHRCGTP